MTDQLINVCVTASNAIYVNDTRITDRSTNPWGGSKTLFETSVADDRVISVLVDNGYKRLLSKIDTEPYLSQANAVLEVTS
jgi:hypothetical protein